MNKNSSVYTFIFAGVLVIVVAFLLAAAATGLKPLQETNVKIEKMQNILQSVGIIVKVNEAEEMFSKYITKQIVIDVNGKEVEGVKAFEIDMKKEQDKAKKGEAEKQLFPLFVCDKEDETLYIIPMRGNGLWGPIWGYISVKNDLNTVMGAVFDHKGETPGLGAEISTAEFQNQFEGEEIFDEKGNYVSVAVIKGGAAPENKHGVDAITGGTITSNGVNEMIEKSIKNYVEYFKSKTSQTVVPQIVDTTIVNH